MARPVTLLRAELGDLDALVALEQTFPGDRLSRRSFRRFVKGDSAEVWTLKQKGRLVGDAVLLYRKGSRSARLYSLVVHPDARGQGIARFLLERLEGAARARGCTRIRLEVREDNALAIRLYERAGFTCVRRIEDYYADGCAALRMEKARSA